MGESKDQDSERVPTCEEVLRPLSSANAEDEKQRVSVEAIRAAIEEGREALAALESAGRHHATLSPKLRFS